MNIKKHKKEGIRARMGAVSFAKQSEEVLLGCSNPVEVIETKNPVERVSLIKQ